MWCIKCQADVAAEISSDNRRILCASCASPIRTVPDLPTEDKTRQARELLARWSKSRWGDSSPKEPALAEASSRPAERPTASPGGTVKPAFRVDESHPDPGAVQSIETASSPVVPSSLPPAPEPNQTALRAAASLSASFNPTSARTHETHGPSAPSPHFAAEPLPAFEAPLAATNLQAFWGQMLAYAGVLALTVGAAFVLMGYFGGPEWQTYVPTGWLITTTGQMLLFLGVVTLVSGGMEQTTEEVARRIDHIGQRMIRIEWASQHHALKGPSVPAEQFQPGGPSHNVPQEADLAPSPSGRGLG